jgi:hypothetical protein
LNEGLAELFDEVSPIGRSTAACSCGSPASGLILVSPKVLVDKPGHSLDECVDRDMTYAAPFT